MHTDYESYTYMYTYICACRLLECTQVAGELGATAPEINAAKAPMTEAGISISSDPGQPGAGGVALALTSSMTADLRESMANPFAAPL